MFFAANFDITSMGHPTSCAAAVANAPINVARNIGFGKVDGCDEVVAQNDTTGCLRHAPCLEQIIEDVFGFLVESRVVVLRLVALAVARLRWILIFSDLFFLLLTS